MVEKMTLKLANMVCYVMNKLFMLDMRTDRVTLRFSCVANIDEVYGQEEQLHAEGGLHPLLHALHREHRGDFPLTNRDRDGCKKSRNSIDVNVTRIHSFNIF